MLTTTRLTTTRLRPRTVRSEPHTSFPELIANMFNRLLECTQHGPYSMALNPYRRWIESGTLYLCRKDQYSLCFVSGADDASTSFHTLSVSRASDCLRQPAKRSIANNFNRNQIFSYVFLYRDHATQYCRGVAPVIASLLMILLAG